MDKVTSKERLPEGQGKSFVGPESEGQSPHESRRCVCVQDQGYSSKMIKENEKQSRKAGWKGTW